MLGSGGGVAGVLRKVLWRRAGPAGTGVWEPGRRDREEESHGGGCPRVSAVRGGVTQDKWVLLPKGIKTPEVAGFLVVFFFLFLLSWRLRFKGCITGTRERPEGPSPKRTSAVRCRVWGQGEKSCMKSAHGFSAHGNYDQNQVSSPHAWCVRSAPTRVVSLSLAPWRAIAKCCLWSLWSRKAGVAVCWWRFLILVEQYKEGFVAFSVRRVVSCSRGGQMAV